MKKILGALVLALFVLFVLASLAFPYFLARPEVQNFLIGKIKGKAGDRFYAEKITAGFFPGAYIEAKGLKIFLREARTQTPVFESEKLRLYLKLLPLVFRRLEIKQVELNGANLFWQLPEVVREPVTIRLKDVQGTIRDPNLASSSRFKLRGKIFSDDASFRIEGKARAALEPGTTRVRVSHLNVRWKIENLLLVHLVHAGLVQANTPLASGRLGGEGSLTSLANTYDISGKAALNFSQLSVQGTNGQPISRDPMSLNVDSRFQWKHETHSLVFEDTPISSQGVNGVLFGAVYFRGAPELDLTLRVKALHFDEIKKLFPGPLDALSGSGSGSFIVKGTVPNLLIHLDADFTGTGLEFGNVFAKPPDFPFVLSFQTYFSGLRSEQGEFNAHLGSLALKGAIEKVDLDHKTGEINFITNKFSLAEWNELAPSLAKYHMSGQAKIASSLKGNYTDLKNAFYNAHVTLDRFRLEREDHVLIEELSGSFDIEPGKMDVQESTFLWQGRAVNHISGLIEWNWQEGWFTRGLRGYLGDGQVLLSGAVSVRTRPAQFHAHLESSGVPVEGLIEKRVLTGFLDATSDVEGLLGDADTFQNSLAGQGKFQVRNGEIHGISLMGALASIPALVGGIQGKRIGGSTEFDSLAGEFQIVSGQVQFPALSLRSRIANAAAQGIIGFDKSISFQGVIELTGGIGGIFGQAVTSDSPLRFPLGVTGTLEHPHLEISQTQVGSTLLTDTLGRFLKKKKPEASTQSSSESSSGSSSDQTIATAAQLLQSLLN